MANVNDIHNTAGRLAKERENLKKADIDERDKVAIRAFVFGYRKVLKGKSPNTLLSDSGNLRRSSERATTPLVEMRKADLIALVQCLTAPKGKGGYGLEVEGATMFGYKRALRIFFRWLDKEPDYSSYEFWSDIVLPEQNVGTVNRDELLDPDEVTAMKQVAKGARNKAIIEMLADTADRRTLFLQLRVGCIHNLDTTRPYYTPNPDGVGHKGIEDEHKFPILDARAELRTYLNRHHDDPDNPNAPLWHVLKGYDPDNPQEGALGGDRLVDMLEECAERSGIDKPVNPHNFRHTALTRLSKAGYSPQEIKHAAGWATDEMLKYYDHTTDEERNERFFQESGWAPDEEETLDVEPAKPKRCGNCNERIKSAERFCPKCGQPASVEARRQQKQVRDSLFDQAVEADDELDRLIYQRMRDMLEENPELLTG